MTAEDNGCLGNGDSLLDRDKREENLIFILIIFGGMIFHILQQYCSEKDTRELAEVFIRSAPPELAIEGFGTELCCSNISPARTAWHLYDGEGVQSGYTNLEILRKLLQRRGQSSLSNTFFLRHGGLDFSKASDTISDYLTSAFPENLFGFSDGWGVVGHMA